MELKSNKLKSLLIILVLFLTMNYLGYFIGNVRADVYIPEENEYNGWHWGVNEGDQLYFEVRIVVVNGTTFEVEMMFKDIWIYNITSIANVTLDWLGVHQFSQINASQCYYNLTAGELDAYKPPEEFALFGYNHSDPINHRYRAGVTGVGLILPLNESTVEVDVLADIINETMYYPAGKMGIFNQFDYYEWNSIQNRIYFSNSTDGYYSDAYYFDDGTLNYGEVFLRVQMSAGPMLISATMKRVFDYNITDEITWGVNIGDTLSYDWYEGSSWIDDADDVKVQVTDISDIMFEKTKNGFVDGPIYMIYQAVYADLYVWNGTDYHLEEYSYPIGFANNFYPQYFDAMGPSITFLYPSNTIKDDLAFMWNNDTLNIWDLPFDEIYISENGNIETTLISTTTNMFAHVIVDKLTGYVESYLVQDSSYLQYYELKTQTLVDWSVNFGDEIYYKQNQDKNEDFKITIIERHSVFVNMTELVAEYNYYGIPLTLSLDQPEFQFFSYLEGNFSQWDPLISDWVWSYYKIIAIANIYWPISPLIFDVGGPPLLMPEDTTSSELTDFFYMFSTLYDDITYGSGYVVLTNSTLDKTMYYYFDEISGKITMMHGWMNMPALGSNWTYMSIYPKFSQAIGPGVNLFQLNTDFVTDIVVTVELEIGGGEFQYIYAFLPYNPTLEPLPSGTALCFFDQLLTYNLVSENITITITFPTRLDLDNLELFFYAYNTSGTEQWDSPPAEFYDLLIYDYGANSITFETPAWGVVSLMSAISYIDHGAVEPAIPGYNLLIFVMLLIIFSGVLIKRKRANNKF